MFDRMVEWPFEGSGTAPTMWQCIAGLGTVLQKAIYPLTQRSVYGAISPKARFTGAGFKVWK